MVMIEERHALTSHVASIPHFFSSLPAFLFSLHSFLLFLPFLLFLLGQSLLSELQYHPRSLVSCMLKNQTSAHLAVRAVQVLL